MATKVIMPKLGMMMEEGTLVRWFVEEGKRVEEGAPLFEVMTDKVSQEVGAPASGILRGVRASPDDVVPVGQVIAYIAEAEESLEETEAGHPRKPEGFLGTPEAPPVPVLADKVRATPAARRAARDAGIDLSEVVGTGPEGRITEQDVKALIASRQAPPAPPGARSIPLRGIRRIIAQKMQESYRQAPHLVLTIEVDMSRALEWQKDLRQAEPGEGAAHVSLTAILVKCVAWALRRHPQLNSTLRGEEIILLPAVNVGVAVALEEGLIVPVIRDADRLSLLELAARLEDLAARAREGKLVPDEVAGGTFTVSNLGMYGIDEFKAIINPPEAAILAVGQVVERPVAVEGQVALRPMVKLSLSADHRIVDGATCARFLQDLRQALERPELMLS